MFQKFVWQNTMRNLKGKNGLITGASSGIGQAIAIRLAREGCNIAISYRKNAEEAKRTEEIVLQYARESGKASNVQTLIVQGDAAKEEDIKFGSLDILINSARIQLESPSHEITTDKFDQVIAVNLRGAYLYARETIKHNVGTKAFRCNYQYFQRSRNHSSPDVSQLLYQQRRNGQFD